LLCIPIERYIEWDRQETSKYTIGEASAVPLLQLENETANNDIKHINTQKNKWIIIITYIILKK